MGKMGGKALNLYNRKGKDDLAIMVVQLQNDLRLSQIEADGLSSVLLDVQQDAIKYLTLLRRVSYYLDHHDHCGIHEGEGLNTDCDCGLISLGIEIADTLEEEKQDGISAVCKCVLTPSGIEVISDCPFHGG